MNTIYTALPSGCKPMGIGDQNLSASRQILAHIGGMMQAVIRHYPVNWAFHWNGIRRAISSGQGLARKRD
jgi:hypothetical protein